MTAFMTACIFVVLAEMGDKTQLLAMAFATKYNWKTVMAGVFVATVFNHLFAVAVGSYLTEFVPMSTIQLAASISFIIFGLWTIRGDKLEGEDKDRGMSPFWTVAVAFFIAEMGDKTQLATVALAAQFNSLIPVWMGTTTGMMIADGFGVVVGNVLSAMYWANAFRSALLNGARQPYLFCSALSAFTTGTTAAASWADNNNNI